MCGRYRLPRAEKYITEHFNIAEEIEWSPRYNVAPAQRVAVVWLKKAALNRVSASQNSVRHSRFQRKTVWRKGFVCFCCPSLW
jgi:putative SOS response-associated peptidase YedK